METINCDYSKRIPHRQDRMTTEEKEEVGKEKEESNSSEGEHYRLAGRPPLLTILALSVGPIASQLIGAFYGVLDTIWISRSVGEIGMTALASYTSFDNIGRAFGFLTSVAGSSKISALFGAGEEKEATQVFCDLVRVCFISGILVPAILVPLVKPGVRWFGASDEVVQLGFGYIFPILMCTTFTCLFMTAGGFLQGEGRSLLFAIIQIISLLINMLVLDPIFLLVFKWGLPGAAWARVICELAPALVILGLFFAGKFSVKPKFSQLFKKFSSHTIPSLKVGMSQLVSNLSVSIPGIINRKLIGSAAHNGGHNFNDVLAGFNALFRYAQVTNNLMIGFTMGFLPAASYSYAANNIHRWNRLQIHLNWINCMWGTITAILSWTIPRQISSIFSSGEGYLKWASDFVKIGNAFGFCAFARFNIPAILQSLQLGLRSTLLSLSSQLVSIIAFALIMYYTNKGSPEMIAWSYSMSYMFGIVIGAIVVFVPVRDIMKNGKQLEKKKNDGEDEDADENETIPEL